MTAVGAASAASYGSGAQMHGLNTAFLAMSFATAVLLLIAVFLVKEKKEPWR